MMKTTVFKKFASIVLFASLSLTMVISPLAQVMPMYMDTDIIDYVPPVYDDFQDEDYQEAYDYAPYEPDVEVEDYAPYEPELRLDDYAPYEPDVEVEDYVPYEPDVEIEISDNRDLDFNFPVCSSELGFELQQRIIEMTMEQLARIEANEHELHPFPMTPFASIPNSGGAQPSPDFIFNPDAGYWETTIFTLPWEVRSRVHKMKSQ